MPDYEDAARSAIKSQHMFNLMHLDSAIKVAERKG
jgi:glycyl-tRNA synthetase alpha subunit